MAQPLDVKQLLATGRQFTDTGRSQAVRLRDDLIEQGRQTTDQISAAIEKLVNPGRNREVCLDEEAESAEATDAAVSETVRGLIRDEVRRQLAALDLTTNPGPDDEVRGGGPGLQVTPPHQRPPSP